MHTRNLALSAVGAALLSSACCTIPALLAAVGVGGSIAGAAFAPWRPVFIGLAVLLLGLAAWSWRRRRAGRCCVADRNEARWTTAALAVAAAVSVGFMAYPAVQAARLHQPLAEAGAAVARLHVDGMTCADCALHVQRALERVPGVARAVVQLQSGKVEVYGRPDAALSPDHLAQVVTRETPYRARAEVVP